MKKIVGTNYLKSPALTAYLSASTSNIAVLCDYAAIEVYKTNSPIMCMADSMEILAEFPKQVVILKNTTTIQKQKIKGTGIQRRMVDEILTKGFSQFFSQLKTAKNGSQFYAAQLRDHGIAANEHARQSLDGANEIRESVAAMANEFTSNELVRLRTKQGFTDDLIEKIQKQILTIAAFAHDSAGINVNSVSFSDLKHSLTFRYSLCCYLISLRWIINGSLPQNPKKIRNHIFDCGFAAYATFFDGLLSDDKEACDTYREAIVMIKALEKL